MKAFRVTIPDYFPDMVLIYVAETASKARFEAFSGMRDANYDGVKFGDIHVIRSPSHDNLARNHKEAEQVGWHDAHQYYGCFDHRELHDKPRGDLAPLKEE